MEKPKEKLWDIPTFLDFLTQEQKHALNSFAQMLFQEAMPLGFIGKTNLEELWQKHIIESLLPLAIDEIKEIFLTSPTLIDLGSGAGLPAIPLAIALPKTLVISVENQTKKATFQDWVKQKLNLKNLVIFADTIENFPKEKKTSLVVFRAFQKILAALELSLYALNPGGLVVYYGAKNIQFDNFEKERLWMLGFAEDFFYPVVNLPNFKNRSFCMFRLVRDPIKPFPRAYRKISKDPLIRKLI